MVTSFTNAAQSQYETVVAVGLGVDVGMGVLVAGTMIGGSGVWVGAANVSESMVCVTMACTVACGSVSVSGSRTCAATNEMGKIAIRLRTKIPKIIIIVLVDSFILYLSIFISRY
jgi:hypothetical protein